MLEFCPRIVNFVGIPGETYSKQKPASGTQWPSGRALPGFQLFTDFFFFFLVFHMSCFRNHKGSAVTWFAISCKHCAPCVQKSVIWGGSTETSYFRGN